MASGRPAIVSLAAGCCRDLIIEGETGYAFDPGDIETLSRLMRRYVENPWLAAEQGVKAAKHIDKFDTQEAVKGIVEAVGKSLEKI